MEKTTNFKLLIIVLIVLNVCIGGAVYVYYSVIKTNDDIPSNNKNAAHMQKSGTPAVERSSTPAAEQDVQASVGQAAGPDTHGADVKTKPTPPIARPLRGAVEPFRLTTKTQTPRTGAEPRLQVGQPPSNQSSDKIAGTRMTSPSAKSGKIRGSEDNLRGEEKEAYQILLASVPSLVEMTSGNAAEYLLTNRSVKGLGEGKYLINIVLQKKEADSKENLTWEVNLNGKSVQPIGLNTVRFSRRAIKVTQN